eukprot:sb/3475370/
MRRCSSIPNRRENQGQCTAFIRENKLGPALRKFFSLLSLSSFSLFFLSLLSPEKESIFLEACTCKQATKHPYLRSEKLSRKTLKSGCLSMLTIRSFSARDGLGLTVRVWYGFGLGDRLGLYSLLDAV